MDLKANVVEVAPQMSFGFRQRLTERLLPLNRHRAEQIFDLEMIKEFAKARFIPGQCRHDFQISGDSIHQFAEEQEAKLNTGGTCRLIAGSVKAELGLSESTSDSMSYAQVRKHFEVGELRLPGSGVAHIKSLQALIIPSTLEALNGCSDLEAASGLVLEFGPYFISQAMFGASFVLIAKTDRASWTSTMKLAASVEADFSLVATKAKADGSCTMEGAGESATYTVTTYALGGQSRLIENADEWNTSAAESPTIINYECRPLYELVNKDTHPRAHSFLMEAVAKFLKDQSQQANANRLEVFLKSASSFSIQHKGTGTYLGFAPPVDPDADFKYELRPSHEPIEFRMKMCRMPQMPPRAQQKAAGNDQTPREDYVVLICNSLVGGNGVALKKGWPPSRWPASTYAVGFQCFLRGEPEEDGGCAMSFMLGHTGWYMAGPVDGAFFAKKKDEEDVQSWAGPIFKVKPFAATKGT